MNESDNGSSGDEQSTAANKSVGSDTSAVTLESNASHHPYAEDYIHLTEEHCRRAYKINSGSKQVSVVCGRPVVAGSDRCQCTSHQNKARRLEGYFRRVPLKSGGIINGKDREYLSQDEWKALKAAEEADRQKDLRRAAERLNTNENTDDSPGVAFDFSANSSHPARDKPSARNTSGGNVSGLTASASQPKAGPEWISGHERKDKARSVAVSVVDRDRLCRHGWNLMAIFDSLDEAKAWLKEDRSAVAAKGGSGKGKGGDDDPDSSSSSSSSSDDDSEPRKPSSKKSTKKPPKKSTRILSSRSSSSSSSSPSDSDDSISSESTRAKKKKKKRTSRRRRHKSSHRSRRSGVRTTNIRLFAKDPSTGDDQSVFGLKISDQDVGKTLCPAGMSCKDRDKFAACIADVAAMPGTYHKLEDAEDNNEKLETVFEGALAMMQQAAGKSSITDAQWKHKKKSTLSGIKSHAELISVAEEIGEAEDQIFQQMDSRVRAFMQRRHYHDEDIDEYLSCGLWMRVAHDTLTYFKGLIGAVKQQAISHDFEGGMAEETLKHYARKLVQIRMLSTSYQSHLLLTYAFLRDSSHNKFVNPIIFRPLLQTLLTQSYDSPVGNGGGRAPSNPTPDAAQKCSHCGSKPLHEKLGVALGRNKCPFNSELSRSQAKQAAKEALQRMQADPQADKKELIKAIIASHKAA